MSIFPLTTPARICCLATGVAYTCREPHNNSYPPRTDNLLITTSINCPAGKRRLYFNAYFRPMKTTRTLSLFFGLLCLGFLSPTCSNAQAPVLTGSSSVTYVENSTAIIINSSVTVTDPDNTTLQGAVITIANFISGQDILVFNSSAATGNITGSFNAGTGVLTLSSVASTATLAQFQSALRSVMYSNSSDNPTTTTRLVNFVVSDGTFSSNSLSNTINIVAVNDAPVLSGNNSITYIENSTPTVLSSGIVVADPDNITLSSATVFISSGFVSGQDILSFSASAGTGNITGSYNAATGILTLSSSNNSGTVAQFQAALRSVTYQNSSDNPSGTTRGINFSVNDGVLQSNAITVTVNIVPVNDAPVLSGSSSINFTENSSAVVVNSSITVADVDNSTLQSATVSISNYVSGEDNLFFLSNATTGNISGVFNSTTGVLTLSSAGNTATVAQFQNTLRLVSYVNTSDNPVTTTRNINYTVSDGSANSNTVASSVTITAVNDAPVLSNGGSNVTYTENATPVIINSNILATDVDNLSLASATITIAGNFASGQDVLSFSGSAGTGNITASYNSSTGSLTLTSATTATLAQFTNAMRSVTYSNTSDNPSTGTRTINFIIYDGSLFGNVASSTINITAVDDAPVLSGIEGTHLSYTAGSGPAVVSAAISVADIDNVVLAGATVSVSPFFGGQDLLSFTGSPTTGNITGSFDNATGVLTISSPNSSGTLAQYQNALRAVTYTNLSPTPSGTSRTVSFLLNDGSLLSNLQSRTIDIAAVVPVTLVSISAVNAGAVNRIGWRTATETPGDGFELQRSADGIHFVQLRSIPATGFASTYTINDAQPLNGINYYRLRITGRGQAIVYSAIVTAVANNPELALIVYPNPAADYLNVTLPGGADEAVELTDVLGKTVLRGNLKQGAVQLHVSGLAAGIYFVQVKNKKVVTEVIVK